MKEKIRVISHRVKSNPVLRESAKSIKPEATFWGFAGVFLFFILPEIIGFIWGKEIAEFAHEKSITESLEIARGFYWALEKLFEDGGSWINLSIGIIILAWMAYEKYRSIYL